MPKGATFFSLPDVDQTGLADGDVFQYDLASGKLVPVALPTPGVSVFQSQVGPVAAGSFLDTDFVHSASIVVAAWVSLAPVPAITSLWEISWVVSGVLTSGKFIGPGVTSISNSVPTAPASGRIRIRIINRDAVDRTYQLFYAFA